MVRVLKEKKITKNILFIYLFIYLFLKQSICPTQEYSVFGERFFLTPLSLKLIVHLNSFLTEMN